MQVATQEHKGRHLNLHFVQRFNKRILHFPILSGIWTILTWFHLLYYVIQPKKVKAGIRKVVGNVCMVLTIYIYLSFKRELQCIYRFEHYCTTLTSDVTWVIRLVWGLQLCNWKKKPWGEELERSKHICSPLLIAITQKDRHRTVGGEDAWWGPTLGKRKKMCGISLWRLDFDIIYDMNFPLWLRQCRQIQY